MGLPPNHVGSFLLSAELGKKKQIPELQDLLGISRKFAIEMYENGVVVNPFLFTHKKAFLQELEMRAPIYSAGLEPVWNPDVNSTLLIDRWYSRAVVWPDWQEIPKYIASKAPKRSFVSKQPPFVDAERRDLYELRKKLLFMSHGTSQILDYHIPVWKINKRLHLIQLIKTIYKIMQNARHGPYKIWFRGQSKEYPKRRSRRVNEWLCYPDSGFDATPSLVPREGRIADEDYKKYWDDWAPFRGVRAIYWRKPFMIWVYQQNKSWFKGNRRLLHNLVKSLRNPDWENWSKLIYEI